MTDLTALQKDAAVLRQKLATAESDIANLRSQIANRQVQVDLALRQGTAGSQRAATLKAQIQALQSRLTQGESSRAGLRTQLGGLLQLPEQPWDLVAQLADSLPFVLLPVRIETRFIPFAGTSELCVRIYPDDIAIHAHEKDLTASERTDGQTFWREMWAAGQETDATTRKNRQQGAWTKLATSYGSPRAAWIANTTRPASLNVPSASALVFPQVDADTLKTTAWSRAPRSDVMPDRFVVMGYRGGQQVFRQAGANIPDPLILGPDPSRLDGEFTQQNGDLKTGPDFAWVSDLEQAIKQGMALRIPLDAATATAGVDTLLVLGLRLSTDAAQTQALLEALVDNHHFSPGGMSLLPQGTPTNNTDGAPSGFSSSGPAPAQSFAIEMGAAVFEPASMPTDKTDAQRLAEALGLGYAPFQHLAGANGRDAREAQLMNAALFPATAAYFMEEMLDLGLDTITRLQSFFTDYVTGRGPLPAIRVGNQPYGILLASNFSAWKWTDAEMEGQPELFNEIVTILQRFRQTWRSLSAQAARIGAGGDPFQDMLSTLGQTPASIEFFRRHATGWETLWNFYAFRPGQFVGQRLANNIVQQAGALLADLGITFPQPPRLFRLAFRGDQDPVLDPLVDDIGADESEKLSETRLLKATYRTPDPANPAGFLPGNYLSWLATCSYADLRAQNLQDMDGGSHPVPRSLLFRLVRSSLLLSLFDTATRLYAKANLLPLAARREIEIANVDADRTLTRWEMIDVPMAKALPALSSSQQSVGDWLLHPAGESRPQAKSIDELRSTLQSLAGLPTARLERILVEHLDVLSYRLDAWQMAFFARRLDSVRILPGAQPSGGPAPDDLRKKGILLGAFGWLENVRPAPPLHKADVTGIPASLYNPQTDGDLFEQPDNGGFIHAPSLNHAVAAAVLRSAYLTHFDSAQPAKMATNLSSARVRTALDFLEGVRNGQELGALLGYQFERGLHDNYDDPLLNQFIPLFRSRYPLVADKITPGSQGSPIETKEARNVLDGYALAEAALLRDSPLAYPYDVQGLPADPHSPQAVHIQSEVGRLAASLDAVADLLLAEGVFQVAQGNFDRAASSVKTLTEGGTPPDPEIARTPRSSSAIHHRGVLHLPAGAAVFWPGTQTQRSLAEPAMNHWLGGLLPAPDKITFRASWPGHAPAEHNLGGLALQPIDLVLMIGDQLTGQETELERRLAYAIRRNQQNDSLAITFEFMTPPATQGAFNLFQLLPLLRRLRNLVTIARALSAVDYHLPSEVDTNPAANLNPQGYDLNELGNRLGTAANRFKTAINGLAAAVPLDAQRNPVLGSLHVETVRAALLALAGFSVPDAVPLSAFGDTPGIRQILAQQALRVLTMARQQSQQADAALVTAATASMPADRRFASYRQAAQAIFGPSFNPIPRFKSDNVAELQAAVSFRDQAGAQGLLRFHADKPLIVDEWLQGAARVRPNLANLEQILILGEIAATPAMALKPLQLPFNASDAWVAVEYAPQASFPQGEFVSLLQVVPVGSFDLAGFQSGLLVDEWVEVVPARAETTGIAIHYDQPASQPPQALILAVPPEITGKWAWETLEGILLDTLDRTRQRAVEPDQLDPTAFGQLLPAVVTAVANRRFATISTDLVYATSQLS